MLFVFFYGILRDKYFAQNLVSFIVLRLKNLTQVNRRNDFLILKCLKEKLIRWTESCLKNLRFNFEKKPKLCNILSAHPAPFFS